MSETQQESCDQGGDNHTPPREVRALPGKGHLKEHGWAVEKLTAVGDHLQAIVDKNTQLDAMNKALKTRLDDSNRLVEEGKTQRLDLEWQLETERKRSHDAAEREEIDSTTLKAARDYYKGQMDMKELELKKLKRSAPPTCAVVRKPAVPSATTPLQDSANANVPSGNALEVSSGKAAEASRRRNPRDGSPAPVLKPAAIKTYGRRQPAIVVKEEESCRILAFETLPYGKS